MVTRLIFNIVLIFLAMGACNRSAQIEKRVDKEVGISQQEILPIENVRHKMDDIHLLLEQGFTKSGKIYDSLSFQLIHDPALHDTIRIVSAANNSIKITIGRRGNQVVGLYSFLDVLGYRFYGPEDYWTYIPTLPNEIVIDSIIHSPFLLRQFNPTFSVGPRNNENFTRARNLYGRWMDRLRRVNNLNLQSGHYGSEFNRRYKNQIIQNPDWRSKDQDGNPRPWSNELKLCYSHPDVIALYKKDAKMRLLQMIKAQQPPYYVNMEPPDGGDFCQCKQCPDQVSDQVYGLANEVARFLKGIDTAANVWLIAYNEHSPPPSFELESNILIGLVPYAFQNNYSPVEFISLWENKVEKLFLRDYLGIPLWNFDEPFWQNGSSMLTRIKRLKSKNYIGYNFESSASFLSVGWPMYLISQAAWSNIEYNKELELFQNSMFPSSGLDLELLIDYFADTKNSSYYLGNLKQLIENAIVKCTNDTELKRLKDFEQYFEYIVLRKEFIQNQGQNKTSARRKLLNYIYDKSNSLNIHAWGVYRSMINNISTTPFGQKFEVQRQEIPRNFTFRSSKPVIDNYMPLHPDYFTDNLDTLPIINFSNDVSTLVFVPDGENSINLKVRNVPSTRHGNGRVSLVGMDGVEITNYKFEHENTGWNDIKFEVPPGDNFYKIKFFNPAARMSVQGPDRPFCYLDPLDTGVLKKNLSLWFYVPPNYNPEISFKYLTRNVLIKKGYEQVIDKFFVEDPQVYPLESHGYINITSTKASYQILGIPHMLSPQKEQIIQYALK